MLLLASTIGSGISLLTIAILSYSTYTHTQQHILPPNISTIAFCSSTFFLSLGVFPMAYVLITEIFPEKVRMFQCILCMSPHRVPNLRNCLFSIDSQHKCNHVLLPVMVHRDVADTLWWRNG